MAYIPVKSVGISDGPNLDAFSRLRVSNPNLIFSALTDTADRVLYWDGTTATGGTSTYNSTSACMELAVNTTSGSRAVRQTREYFAYRAAQAQLIFVTFAMNDAKANLTQRVGYFDDAEGIYLERSGASTVSLNILSNVTGSPTYETAAQSTWNLDKLTGVGGAANPSGLTLNLDETQILIIDFQWLGVGRVRMGFDIGGQIIYVHEFDHANTSAGNSGLPYLKSPKLPIRYEITNTNTTASASTLCCICAALVREGAGDAPSPVRSVFTNPTTSPTTSTTFQSILGIRLNSANKRSALGMIEIDILNDDTEHLLWYVVLNPTWVTGTPTWVGVPGADAISEMSRTQLAVTVSATARIEGYPTGANSLVLASGWISGGTVQAKATASAKIEDSIRAVSNYAGTQDEIWLCCALHTGSGAVDATITFKEYR